jgi:hypothetical protein
MTIDDFRRLARGWLLDLANNVWPEEHIDLLADKTDALKELIRRGYDALLRRRRALERLHAEMDEQEQRAIALPWQVDGYLQVGNKKAAWRAAMELEEVRAALANHRTQVASLERENREQLVELQEQRRALGRMQSQLMKLRHGSLAATAQ